MNRRLASVFLIALVVAGAASMLLYYFLSTQLSHAQVATKGKLLVASHDLQVGSLIKDTDVQLVSWNGALPEEAVKESRQVIGRGVIANIYQGEPIMAHRLAPKGAGAGLAATIPVGKRAVALKVNEVVGLAGFVLPGMRVDVIVSDDGRREISGNQIETRTLLQNLEVLSAGQHIERNAAGKPEDAEVVNLLVDPDQAEILSLASSEMKVQLVLRNPLDTGKAETHGTSIAQLFGQSKPAPAADPPRPIRAIEKVPVKKEEAKAPTIEIFTGGKRTEEAVAWSGGAH